MGIIRRKNDNLVNFIDGLSLLDEQEQKQIINMVDTLDSTDRKVKDRLFSDVPPLKLDFTSAYADDKI